MRIQLFIWSTFINATFSFAMVALVLFSRPLTKVKTYWTLMCVAVGLWSIGLGWMSSVHTFNQAILGSQLVTGASIFIPTFLFHTVHSLLHKKSKLSLVIMYGWAFILTYLNLQGELMSVRPALDFPFYTHAKPAYISFMVYLYLGFAVIIWDLWKAAQSQSPLFRKQLMSLFWGASLGFIGGQTTVPLVYDVHFFPYGIFFVPVYILTVAHGMLKYQFMDFRLALRKLGLTIAIYTFLIALVSPIGWPIYQSLRSNNLTGIAVQILSMTGLLTLIVASGPIIYAFILHRSFWLKGHTTIGLTHELKSPLANIRSSLDFISTHLKEGEITSRNIIEYAEIIDRNTLRLEESVNDLLCIAAIQEGKINLDPDVFHIQDLTTSILENYKGLAKEKGIEIVFEQNISKPIHGDPAKIQQVISNLIANAFKFSSQGKIKISINHSQREVVFSIKDEGCGINPKNLNRVFDRFYQAGKMNKGTGIGLTIAKAWINAHGGKIWAESEGEKKGAIVTFTLPQHI